ncbi:MAG: acyl-CoA synthetase [Planctomycetes bacterium]|nr:acyl-CoA synthetase [Planctomycetota bacterium]
MGLTSDIIAATLDFLPGDGTCTARLRFSGREDFFQGHFPGGPVLPAVVQIAAVVNLASRLAGQELRLSEVTRAKFMNPTGPGRELAMQLTLDPEVEGRRRVKATLFDGELEVAELTLRVT